MAQTINNRDIFETMSVGRSLRTMAIPTIISGIYGMNVSEKWMPLAKTPYGFGIICVLILVACVITMKVLKKRKML